MGAWGKSPPALACGSRILAGRLQRHKQTARGLVLGLMVDRRRQCRRIPKRRYNGHKARQDRNNRNDYLRHAEQKGVVFDNGQRY